MKTGPGFKMFYESDADQDLQIKKDMIEENNQICEDIDGIRDEICDGVVRANDNVSILKEREIHTKRMVAMENENYAELEYNFARGTK